MPRAETLLPGTTRGFFSTPNWRKFDEVWAKTSFAALLNDPAVKEFRQAAEGRLDRGEVIIPALLGLTYRDVKEAVTGEMAVAIVQDGPSPALILLLDVTGNNAVADLVLERAGKRLVAAGSEKGAQRIGGQNAAVYSLPDGLRFGLMQKCHYLRQGDWLIASSSAQEIQGVLERLGTAAPPNTLGKLTAFQTTTAAAEAELTGGHARWFAEPLAFWEALRIFYGEKPREKVDRLQVFKKEGFTALQGIGGAIVLSTGANELLARGYVHAPGPFQRAARMLDLPNMPVVDPPVWVSRQVARCLALSVKFPQAFDAYPTLFDSLYGDGKPNVFGDLMKRTRDDPDGPQVDVRKQLVAPLQGPLWLLGLRPEKATGLEWLRGVTIPSEKSYADALGRLFDEDEQVKTLKVDGTKAWRILSEKELPKPKKKEKKTWSLPPSTQAAARQAWLMAQTPGTLEQVLRKEPPLAAAPEYQEMIKRLGQEVGPAACLRGFIRNEDEIRDTWEGFRNGTLPADRWERKVLKKLFVARGDRDALPFNMTLLPAFAQVQKHIRTQTGVAAVAQEKKGWSLLFLIPRP